MPELALAELDPCPAGFVMQHYRPRLARRTHLGCKLQTGRRNVGQALVAQPVHVAQKHLAGLQRLARADDHPRTLGVEMHHIERLAWRDTPMPRRWPTV